MIVKYIKDNYEDSAGHSNELLAIGGINIVRSAKQMLYNVELVRFKDHKALIDGKQPCPDRIHPESLFIEDIELTSLDVHNAIVEAIAKKGNLEVIEIDENIELRSPEKQISDRENGE